MSPRRTVPQTAAPARRRRTPVDPVAVPDRVAQFARALAADIIAGRHPIGSPLPADTALAAAHKLSRPAVAEALQRLEGLGLVARRRGGPVLVISAEIRAGYELAGFAADLSGGAYATLTTIAIERQRRIEADAELASELGVAEGSEWLHLVGLRHEAGAGLGPLSCLNAWLRTRRDRVVAPPDLTPTGIEALTGGAVAEVQVRLLAGALAPMQARILQTRGGAPCLHLLRCYLRRGGAVLAAVRDTHPAERLALGVRLRPAGTVLPAALRDASLMGSMATGGSPHG